MLGEQKYIEDVNPFTSGDLLADELAVKLIKQPQLDDEISIKEESEDDIEQDPELKILPDDWTDDDGDDNEEKLDTLVLKKDLTDDEDYQGKKLKVKKKCIRNRPPFRCPFCKTYSVPLFRSTLNVIKHLQNCKLESTNLSEITCLHCNQFKCSSDNLVKFYHHVLSCLTKDLEGLSERVTLNFRVFQCNLCQSSSEKTRELFRLSQFLDHIAHHKRNTFKI